MKKIMIILFLVLSVVLVLTSSGIVLGKELKLGHLMGIQHPHHAGALKFAELVRAKTNGSLTVKVFPSSQLGGALTQIESLKMGTLDLFLDGIGIYSQLVKDYNLPTTTYALRDSEHYMKVMRGEIGKEAAQKLLSEHGIRMLEPAFLRAPRHLISTKPIKSLNDIKKLKLRVPQLAGYIEPWKALGAAATPIAFPEVYMALKQGVVDAAEVPLTFIYSQKFYEVAKYVTLTAHLYEGAGLTINEKLYQSLTSGEKKAINEAAKEACDFHNDLLLQVVKDIKEILEAEGVILIDIDRDELISKVKDIPYDLEGKGLWPEGLYDRALNVK
jgi:tripartite ATP-independent transporter DctP family solute receptor